MIEGIVVAIDGPVASGKDTVSRLVAHKLSGIHLNSGAFFRAIAILCIKEGISFTDKDKIITHILPKEVVYLDGRIIADNNDVTEQLSTSEVAKGASEVAVLSEVQQASILFARTVIKKLTDQGKVVIIDGRNAATAIYPEADVKIMLLASLSARVKRRMSQYRGENRNITEKVIENDIISRDNRDMSRKIYPLVSKPKDFGYIVVDTSDQTVEESVNAVIKVIEEKL